VTLSVLGLDAARGQLGVASATHGVAVGARVPWARSGVGVAVTQAMTRRALGRGSIDELTAGATPQAVLERVLASDPGAANRQLAVLDVHGCAALHTGARVPGHTVACAWPDLVVVGNMLRGTAAAEGAREAFLREPRRPLAHRLLDALAAGDRTAGDCRGVRSASLTAVSAVNRDEDIHLDLRVDDSARPIDELNRLLRLHDVQALLSALYADPELRDRELANAIEGFLAERSGDPVITPYLIDLQFWLGIGQLRRGATEVGSYWLEQATQRDPAWRALAAQVARSEGLALTRDPGFATRAARTERGESPGSEDHAS
jgi:uncharacterized Ntn-hydrolase superfamily protein